MVTDVTGQNISISGWVKDQSTGSPISYATIRLEGSSSGTLSNSEGFFKLNVDPSRLSPQSILLCSSIGYKSFRIKLGIYQPDQVLDINMEPSPYTLQAVYIYPYELSARDMVSAALNRVKKNYADDPYQLRTFYRHYCSEKGNYGRLIEAAVDIYDRKGHRKKYKNPEKKLGFDVRQLRRSFDFTRFSARRHIPIGLNVIMSQDLVSYKSSRLHAGVNSKRFTFRFSDTTSYQNKMVFVIECEGPSYQSRVFINAEDLAVLKLEEDIAIESKREFNRLSINGHFITEYQNLDGKYYLSHMLNTADNLTIYLDSTGSEMTRSQHSHYIELMVSEVKTDIKKVIKTPEPDAEALKQVPYDPDFWINYNTLAATPLEEAIEKDLAKRMPLEKQFTNFNEPDAETLDWLQVQNFNRLLEENRDKHILVYFWKSSSLPGIRQLLLARKLAKSYTGAPLILVFASMDTDEESWRKSVRNRGMYVGYNFYLPGGANSPLAKQYGVSSVPHYLVLGPGNEVLLNTGQLPPKKQLKDVLSGILSSN